MQQAINVSLSLPRQWPNLIADHASFLLSTHFRALLVIFKGQGQARHLAVYLPNRLN